MATQSGSTPTGRIEPTPEYGEIQGREEEVPQTGKDPLMQEDNPSFANRPTIPAIPENDRRKPWKPGILYRFPWFGVLPLLLALLCMAAAVAVIALSNGETTDSWQIQPTVLLAIASAAANTLLAAAFAGGVELSWWKTALAGASMSDLHHRWMFSRSVWSALASARQLNSLTIASFFASIVIIDGPLLQRATSVVPRNYTIERPIVAHISDTIPPGYTGNGGKYSLLVDYFTPEFSRVVSAYSARRPIDVSGWGCNGTCTGSVAGAGLVPICTKSTNDTKFPENPKPRPENETTLFDIDFKWGAKFDTPDNFFDDVHARLDTLAADIKISPKSPCDVTWIKTACRLQPAVVEYAFNINHGSLTLVDNIDDLPVLSLTDVTVDPNHSRVDYPGIAHAAQSLFRTTVRTVSHRLSGKLGFNISGSVAHNYFEATEFDEGTNTDCFFTFKDPAKDMLRNIHEMMF
ncbi:hypothetical protein AJ79_02246 [Helicocarpus griseus UAMH5409]|uniref:Uncharacterized protein n=1 Tax=Helicocarpus griseus UAMH5409 TaxID=1447875 RepID=A0A2B7Y483_9EURO|nr:hypothetical protein AJ79_02246 [Helicocarpus griseus UAMH5409]